MIGRLDDWMKAIVARDGLRVDEFDTYGATARTLRAFVKAHDLIAVIRDIVVPNPDVRAA